MTNLNIHGYTDGDVDTNRSTATTLNELAAERYSRRQTLFGGLGATAMALLGTTMLSACNSDFDTSPTVSAGSNGASTSGRVVTLAGSASDNGSVSGVAWVQTSGPSVALTGANTTTATFLAPSVSAPTPLTFTFTATDNKGKVAISETTVTINPAILGFTAIAKNKNDIVTVPEGYKVTVMTRLGDPLAAGVAAYRNDGTDTDFANRIGDHGDALAWFGISAAGARDDASSTRGLVVQNHENINIQYLHPAGPTNVATGLRPEAEALKEIECHGVSVSEFADSGNRTWAYVQNSAFNHRVTPSTPTVFNGPAKGSDLLKTVFSTDGTQGRGTINNCANGRTAWATNLTCEENWAGYFRRDNSGGGTDNGARTARELTALRRYGVTRTPATSPGPRSLPRTRCSSAGTHAPRALLPPTTSATSPTSSAGSWRSIHTTGTLRRVSAPRSAGSATKARGPAS
ncbi:MAG TPA: alkaline phosphatase PhoX [Novosphingobium sp.]